MEIEHRALAAAALGVVALTLAGMDTPWSLIAARGDGLPEDVASGSYLVARLVLAAAAVVLILGAAAILFARRERLSA
jgi:hypothetical protein